MFCHCLNLHTSSEPDGMAAPEVVPVNSSTVRVLWLPPLRPNGAVTGYHIYVNGRLHGSVDNSSGSYLLGDLLPFTVYNTQVHSNKSRHAYPDLQMCIVSLFTVFLFCLRWKCVLCTLVRGVMSPRQLLWRMCPLTWPHHMLK